MWLDGGYPPVTLQLTHRNMKNQRHFAGEMIFSESGAPLIQSLQVMLNHISNHGLTCG